ncbi:MAG: trypsin-like peptidase domain-containing protein [Pseudomonadota bacterium]
MIFEKYIPSALCLVLFFSLSANSSANNDEEVFTEALKYTIKVRTRVETPFLGESRGSSSGAGFIVDAKRGWVMTNAHVASRSPSFVTVNFHKGQDYHSVKKLYVDPYLDFAMLEVPTDLLPDSAADAKLDCETIPGVGHPVGAFGHPWSLSFTGTRGIISGITSKLGGGEMLQTDAPINQGNSGGPLISMNTGKVVGINTATLSKSRNQNTNFAIPMKYACKILQLLQEDKSPLPPALPILFLLDLHDRRELEVATTYLDKNLIDLRVGDIVQSVIGHDGDIENEGHLVNALRGQLAQVALKVLRNDESITINGRLDPAKPVDSLKGVHFSGLLIAPMPFRDWAELNLPGFMIHDVKNGSIAQDEGLITWDLIVAIDGEPVKALNSMFEQVQKIEKTDEKVKIKVKRFSKFSDRFYDYVERPIPVEDLKFVGY